MRMILFIFSLFLTVAASINAQEMNTPTLKQRFLTVAGELKVFQLDERLLGDRFSVTLNNDVILTTNGEDESSRFHDFPATDILKHISRKIPPFDEVIIFQQNMWGNACSGGPIWFLGLKKNGSFEISDSIGFCGGKDPIIREGPDRITVIIPGGPPNRGSGYIPGVTWIYKNGEVKKVNAPKKQKTNF
jgi:hypothetical protein